MLSRQLLGSKIRLYKRENSSYWQCCAYLEGTNHRISTKTDSLEQATVIAEDWYIDLRAKARAGLLIRKREKTFADAAAQFQKEYHVITDGTRSQRWTDGHAIRLRVHILPFFEALPLSQVTAGKVQEYRLFRMTPSDKPSPFSKSNRPHKAKPPARNTLHNEIVTIRQVLKTAHRHGWVEYVPDLSAPYKGQSKVSHRGWFSPAEYKQLYTATRTYAKSCPERIRWSAEQVHDYVLFMANTGLRPDEARNLQHRDVQIVKDETTGETILLIEVRGKRGVGYCKSMIGAVKPYQRLLNRKKHTYRGGRPKKDTPRGQAKPALPEKVSGLPQPMDPVFPGNHIKLFNALLNRIGLKHDRDNNARTAYSLRHTYSSCC